MFEPDLTTRHVLVIYTEHELSLEDPLNPGEYNDTAQAQYASDFIQYGMTTDEWIAAGFNIGTYPPLATIAELQFGDSHKMDVIHVGLDSQTGIITPYIVPTADYPNGYFVKNVPTTTFRNALIAAGLDPDDYANVNGWTNWGGPGDSGAARIQNLLADIVASDYLDTYLSADLKYDKNHSGKFDLVLLATPQLYKRDYYVCEEQNSQPICAIVPPKVIFGTSYNTIIWTAISYRRTYITVHEYYHGIHSFWPGTDESVYYTDELFADKTWVGVPSPFPIRVVRLVEDVYSLNDPLPPTLYGGLYPCISAAQNGLQKGWCGVQHPLQAASIGLTTLNRWATTNGNYAIGNFIDSYDYLCMQSPYDQTQFLVLSAFKPKLIGGTTEYPWGGNAVPGTNYYPQAIKKSGIHATVIKFNLNKPMGLGHSFSYSQYTGVLTSYMLDTMTEYWSYGDLWTQATRTRHDSVVLENPKLVLLDHANPTTNPTGLSVDNASFGVRVQWVGWSVVDGVDTAIVNITFDAVTAPTAPVIAVDTNELSKESSTIYWEVGEGDLGELQLSSSGDFDDGGSVTVYDIAGGRYQILGLNPDTTYHVRVRAHDHLNYSEWSNVVSFTTLRTFWLFSQLTSGLLSATIELPVWVPSITVTLAYTGQQAIVFSYKTRPGLMQTIVLPSLFPGAGTVSYKYYGGKLTRTIAPASQPTVALVSKSSRARLGASSILSVTALPNGWTCYLCLNPESGDYKGIHACIVKGGAGIIYDNLTEGLGYDHLSSESIVNPFLLPDGTPFGAHISLIGWVPGTDNAEAFCRICMRQT
jgi:hypothetical protein